MGQTISSLATWNNLLELKTVLHGVLLTWWRSFCQTSASDPSWYLPHSVSCGLRLTAMQALPTDRPSHGCGLSLVSKQRKRRGKRGDKWVHKGHCFLLLEFCGIKYYIFHSPVPKLSSPHSESLPASIRFPKNFQPVGVSYSCIFRALATLE